MDYGREVINLLNSFPNKRFKMRHFVDYINNSPTPKERDRIRQQVRRVLELMEDLGTVTIERPDKQGGDSWYRLTR